MRVKNKVDIYSDGTVTRLHNKRITMVHTEKGVMLEMVRHKQVNEDLMIPVCVTGNARGKLRCMQVKLSHETMEAIIHAYFKYIETNTQNEQKSS